MSRTREKNREYMRDYRARQRAAGQMASVTQLHPGESAEAAVTEELSMLPLSAKQPASVAIALAMARILDNPSAVPQHPQAGARLMEVMRDLRQEVESGKSKLSTLRAAREDRA